MKLGENSYAGALTLIGNLRIKMGKLKWEFVFIYEKNM